MIHTKKGLELHTFESALKHINKIIYEPHQLTISSIEQEAQNAEYAAGLFTLSSESTIKTARFRVAKQTPKKVGQLVTFWEKDYKNINRPFQYERSPDLLIVTTFKDKNTLGQFVFPKHVLLRHHVLQSQTTKGKMAMRVYPSWDKPENNAALKTQNWQLEYCFIITDESVLPTEKIQLLYEQ